MKAVRRIAVAAALAAMTAMGAVTYAQSVLEPYDTARKVTLKGTLRLWNLARPHTYLLVDTTDASGKTESWTVQTGSTVDFIKAGMDVGPRGTLKTKDPITIDVYLPKPGAKVPDVPDTVRPAVIDYLKGTDKRAYGVEAQFGKDPKKYVIAGAAAQATQ